MGDRQSGGLEGDFGEALAKELGESGETLLQGLGQGQYPSTRHLTLPEAEEWDHLVQR